MANKKRRLQKAYVNQNPQDYFNLVSDRSGLGTGAGVQPFHDWVKTSGYEQVARGYSDRLLHKPKLGFGKYMQQAYRVPNAKKQNAFAPQKRGNPAMVGLGTARNQGQYRTFANAMRQQFLRLTPEQAGTYAQGYAMGPSRWSVFG